MSKTALKNITHGLVIREPWVSYLCSGKKTWELRSKKTAIRGRIALIRGGSGLIVGTAELTECLEPLTRKQMLSSVDKHRVPLDAIEPALKAGWTFPWVMRNVIAFKKPVPYTHPSGAVTWVLLNR